MKPRRGQSPVRWVLTIVIVIALLAGAGILVLRWVRPTVTVTEVVEGPVVQAFYATGTVAPEREFPIKSATAGILTKLLVDKGDHVKKDQALAIVSDPALQFTFDKAKAELTEKQTRAEPKTSPVLMGFDAKLQMLDDQLSIAKREQARYQQLVPTNAASQSDLDKATDRVKSLWGEAESVRAQRAAAQLELEREVEVAQSAVNIAQWDLDQQTLKSPIDGVVLDRPTSQGTRVAINDQIMRVADVSPANLVMRAAVDEEDIGKVRVDQLVRMTLYSYAGQSLSGKVSKIYDEADRDRRTFEVDVRLNPHDQALSPGMTGELAIIHAEKASATVVPSQSIQNGKVYIVRDGQIHEVDAKIGLRSVQRTEIISGVKPGDRVVISPIGSMKGGQQVGTDYLDPSTAAGLNKEPDQVGSFKGFN
jgi:multidrug efflux pump subunit AcrA (membrane-fusion protein)